MNTLQVEDPIERNTQVSLDVKKMRDGLAMLVESERVVLELGFGLVPLKDGTYEEGPTHSLDAIAKKLGRTKHWAIARYQRGIGQIRETMGIEISASLQSLSPSGAVENLQEEVELKSAILGKWKGSEQERAELGTMLLQLRDILAIPGRKGQFSSWLEDNHIPRATAYRYIADVEPEEDLADSKDDKASQAGQFDSVAHDKRFAKLYRTVLKFYDCFNGNRNAAQIMEDWDRLQSKIRAEMVKTLGLEAS